MIRTIYLIHHTHTDIGYTDTIDKVMAVHVRLLDKVVRLCRANAGRAEGLRYKWTVETALVLEEYRKRSPRGFAELMALARDRLVEVCGLWSQSLTELPSLQELVHLVGRTGEMGREHGFPVRTAMLNDIQCGAGALPAVLAAAGVRYFVNGANVYRTQMPLARDLPPLFRWQGPAGGDASVLLWQFQYSAPDDVRKLKSLYPQYALGYFHVLWPLRGWYDPVHRKYLYDPVKGCFVASEPTPRQRIAMARRGIDELCQRLEKHRYPYDAILLQAGADNFGPDELMCETVERWNDEIGEPAVRIATPSEFFQHIEQKYGRRIPALKGHISDPWSDHSATKAGEMARYRQALRTVRAAGRAQALAMLAGNGAASDRETFGEAMRSLMMTSEHTYGLNTFALNEGIIDGKIRPDDKRLAGPLESWKVKERYSRTAERASRRLLESAMESLAKRAGGAEEGVLVFNELDRPRGGVIDVGGESLMVNDAAPGVTWYPQRPSPHPSPRVPGEGVEAAGTAGATLARGEGEREPEVIANDWFRVRVDGGTGAASSVIDLGSARELIDAAGEWRANQLVAERIIDFPRDTSNGGLTVPRQRQYAVADPSSVRIRRLDWAGGPAIEIASVIHSGDVPIRLKSIVRLPAYARRVEFINRVQRAPAIAKEAIYIAFPFAAGRSSFSVRCEVAGGVITLGKDQLPGSGGDYQAIQGAVAIDSRGNAGSILWASPDAPLVCVGGMYSMRWRTGRDRIERPHLFSYAMHNTWPTNCPLWQTESAALRYAIGTSAKRAEADEIVHFGRDFASPLVAVRTPARRKSARREPLPKLECEGAIVEAIEPLSEHEVRIILSGEGSSNGGTVSLRLGRRRKDVPLAPGGLTIATMMIG